MLNRKQPLRRQVVTAEEFEALVRGHINEFVDEELARALVAAEAIVPEGAPEPADLAWGDEFPDLTRTARSWPMTDEERREQHHDRVQEERTTKPKATAGGRGKTSSYQKLLDAMPGTGRKVYDLGRKLATLNPRGGGVFDTTARQVGKALGISYSVAASYIRLHLEAGVWGLVQRASLRGRRPSTYRIVPTIEIDFEAAAAVYTAFRDRQRSRTATMRATQTPHANA